MAKIEMREAVEKHGSPSPVFESTGFFIATFRPLRTGEVTAEAAGEVTAKVVIPEVTPQATPEVLTAEAAGEATDEAAGEGAGHVTGHVTSELQQLLTVLWPSPKSRAPKFSRA